jgi:hypothetical protein
MQMKQNLFLQALIGTAGIAFESSRLIAMGVSEKVLFVIKQRPHSKFPKLNFPFSTLYKYHADDNSEAFDGISHALASHKSGSNTTTITA